MANAEEVGSAFNDFVKTSPMMWKIVKVLAFVVFCLVVSVVVLELQLSKRTKAIDRIEDAVVRIEGASQKAKVASDEAKTAAADSKAASEKASADLANALAQVSTPSPSAIRTRNMVDELYEVITGKPAPPQP